MTATTAETDYRAAETAPASASSTAIDSAEHERRVSRREGVLVTALAALVAAVVLFGLAFPALLAPAVGIAVLAVIIALEWLLPSGELRRASTRRRRH